MSTPVDKLSTRKLLARIGLRFLILLGFCLAIFLLVATPIRFLMPFIIAYLVSAALLIPIIKKISIKSRKLLAIVLVIVMMAIVVIVFSFAVSTIVKEGFEIYNNRESYFVSIEENVTKVVDYISSHTRIESKTMSDLWERLKDEVENWVMEDLPGDATDLAMKLTKYIPSLASSLLAIFFFFMATYFICSDYPNLSRKLRNSVPVTLRPQIRDIRNAASYATFGYMRAQIIISSIGGIFALVVLLSIGQRYAAFVAIASAIADFIPMLGSGIVLIPLALLFVIKGNIMKGALFFGISVIIFLFRRIMEPKIVGDQTGLHPLLSLMALYAGIKIGGLVGLILAPIVCIIIVGLYKKGFFKPTITDFKEIFKRMALYSEMVSDDPEIMEKERELERIEREKEREELAAGTKKAAKTSKKEKENNGNSEKKTEKKRRR